MSYLVLQWSWELSINIKNRSIKQYIWKAYDEVKKVNHWIRKAQDHDHSLESFAKPNSHNEGLSQFYKLEMKNKHAETGLNTLEEQLKKARVEISWCQIQENIHFIFDSQ